MSHRERPARRYLTAIPRAFAWPVRRLLDPRFRGLAEQAETQHGDVAQRLENLVRLQSNLVDRETMQYEVVVLREELRAIARADREATSEATELIGRTLGDLLSEAGDLLSEAGSTTAAVERLTRQLAKLPEDPEDQISASVDELDPGTASLLNYAASHTGFAAQRGVWFNPPVSLLYEPGRVRPADVNERIVELPYVYRALARVYQGASVLDVGAAESTVAFSLASLGYDVVALDLHPYPFSHPRLRSVQADILEWEVDESFDVILCISTLEHIGLGAYGEKASSDNASADGLAVERFRALLPTGGILVLTVPFGAASNDETQRSYDRPGLERLLKGWKLEDITIVRRHDSLTWCNVDENGTGRDDERQVALITAVRPQE
jgi:SAM-dependent methyltransferase